MTLNRKNLRKALRNWDQSATLGESPFAEMRLVEARRQTSGYGENTVGYGIALREVLLQAIEAIKPQEEDPDPLRKTWRHYLIIEGEYIQGRSSEFLASQMGIARNTYNHEKAAALDRLLSRLVELEENARIEPYDVSRSQRISVPSMAPPGLPKGLVGREDLLSLCSELLSADERIALHGLPGVGKTALAIELSHRLNDLSPDGVFWTSLGPSPDVPMQFHLWEMAIGLQASEVSDLLDSRARAAQLHSVIGDRKMLLIVDDVWEEAAARAFEVGGVECKYIFTSRSPSISAALAGERALGIPELEEESGLELLERYVPGKQISTDSRRRLVSAAGGLPQALVIAGNALRTAAYADQPRRLSDMVARLADPSERLKLERAQSALDQQSAIPVDQPISVQAIIALSDEALPPVVRSTLRSLSVMPPKPSTFGHEAATAIASATDKQLDQLADAGLLEPSGSDRYAIHRTIRDFARTRADYDAPVEAMVEYFLDFTQENTEDYKSLHQELQNALTALWLANEHNMPSAFSSGVNALFPYLDANGLLDEAISLLQAAIESSTEDPRILLNAGRAYLRQGETSQACRYFETAGKAEDPVITSAALLGQGACEYAVGNLDLAAERYSQGLAIARENGLHQREAALLTNMGILAVSRGDSAEAESGFREALGLARAGGDRALLGSILTNLGVIAAQSQQFDAAGSYFSEAIEMARADGNRRVMAYLHINVGAMAHDRGDLDRAQDEFEAALDLARELGDQQRISHVLASLTAVAIAQKRFDEAREYVLEGLSHARNAQLRETVVLLLINQAELNRELGKREREQELLLEAGEIAEEIDHDRYRAIISERLSVNLESV